MLKHALKDKIAETVEAHNEGVDVGLNLCLQIIETFWAVRALTSKKALPPISRFKFDNIHQGSGDKARRAACIRNSSLTFRSNSRATQ